LVAVEVHLLVPRLVVEVEVVLDRMVMDQVGSLQLEGPEVRELAGEVEEMEQLEEFRHQLLAPASSQRHLPVAVAVVVVPTLALPLKSAQLVLILLEEEVGVPLHQVFRPEAVVPVVGAAMAAMAMALIQMVLQEVELEPVVEVEDLAMPVPQQEEMVEMES
jgi:hypothetical protein